MTLRSMSVIQIMKPIKQAAEKALVIHHLRTLVMAVRPNDGLAETEQDARWHEGGMRRGARDRSHEV